MNEDSRLMFEVAELTLHSMNGTLNDQGIRRLELLLEENPLAVEYYQEILWTHVGLNSMEGISILQELDTCYLNRDFWTAMLQEEKTAPEIGIPEEQTERQLIQKVVYPPREKRKLSKFGIFMLFNAAAMVLFFLFLRFTPPKGGIEVASLVDQIDAKWARTDNIPKPGSRLWTNEMPLHLQSGIISIRYDDGVDILVEGPAVFEISKSAIFMEYGRLYSRVSMTGIGFIVRTPVTQFVDLGTEFGVQADVNGSAELHVVKGKVQLFVGPKEGAKSSLVVTENRAIRYNANSFKVDEIPLAKQSFARSIDSKTKTVWRGQTHIDLADIVGGGNGTGNGRQNSAIQWDGQDLVDASKMPSAAYVLRSYVPVHFSRFIDGIFVPSSRGEPVKLSSETAQLNLDEFLKKDTNGLITLMVLKEDSDSASSYWFCSKEGAAGDRARMFSLYFPKGSNGQPASVTTSDGRGADTCLVNDVRNSRVNRGFGAASFLPCRYIKDERMRMIYLRIDISQVEDLSGAVLNLCLDSGNRRRVLNIYGLKDGPADFWNEESLDYNTAPGLKPAALGNYEFDETMIEALGTFRVIDNRPSDASIVISSDKLFRWTCPESVSQTAYAITNADNFRGPLSSDSPVTLQLGNQFCGGPDNPSILMHANAGITFDLEAMRKEYGSLKSFTAVCGLSPSARPDADVPSASFYVLLDGEEVFSAVDLTPEEQPQDIDLELTAEQRYLTLITTQGTDGAIDDDLCVFTKPRITIETGAGMP